METTQHPRVKILATSAVVIALPLALLADGMFPEAPPPGRDAALAARPRID